MYLCCSALAASVAALPAFGKVGAANAADEGQGVASSRMSYSRFLEYLDMGRVKKVQPHRLYHLDTFWLASAGLMFSSAKWEH